MNDAGSSNEYRQVEALFQQALDLAPDRRAGFLERQCPPELRGQVQTLLRHYTAAPESYLGPTFDRMAIERAASEAPRRIGRYEIVRLIGRGGMGAVYEARQDNPRRTIAVKVIRSPLASPEAQRRFEYEASILGRLHHPGIAHIYEAGVSEQPDPGGGADRQPYLAMELIEGVPLQQFVRGLNDLPSRLKLFVQICEAVEHAHQKGVIHRDLKPANILVMPDGQPKVVDFGVARATDSDGGLTTMHTQAAQVLGTIPYMSPEQVSGRVEQVDTRSDVYSLGVILYELLAGRLPYALSDQNLVTAARTISETPPAALASQNRACRGDLETIVHKALEKEAGRRYPSVQALAADVSRYLNREPITARPASALYQMRRFAQRHTAWVAGLSLALAALLLGLAGTGYGLFRAQAARAQADQRSQQLEQVAEFQAAQLSDIDANRMGVRLRAALLDEVRAALARSKLDPAVIEQRVADAENLLDGSNFTNLALQMLDENVFERALGAIEQQFPDQPLVRARLLHTTAHALRELGLLQQALAPQQEALRLWRAELGDDDRSTLSAVNNLGHALHAMGKPAEAEPHLRAAVDGYRRTLGDEHPETLAAVNNLAALLRDQDNLAEAEPLYLEALEGRRRALGEDHASTLNSYNNVASLLMATGKHDEGVAHYRKALEGRRRLLGDGHRDTLNSLMNLGIALVDQGRFAEAEPLLREAVDGARRFRGDEHPDTQAALFYLGSLLREQGRLAEAEPLLREALEGRYRTLGRDHKRSIQALGMLAALIKDQGRPREAEALFREALERNQRVYGPDHPGTIAWVNCVGLVLMDQKRPAEAEEYFRTALAARRRVLGDEHPETLPSISNVGSALLAQDRLAEAEPFLVEGLEIARRVLGDDHPTTLATMHNLARLLRRLDRLEEAEALGAEAVRRAQEKLPQGHANIATYLAEHGITRAHQGRFAEAETELREAYQRFVAALGPDHDRTKQCVEALADMYDAWHTAEPAAGHHVQADDWRSRLAADPAATAEGSGVGE